MKLTGYVAWIVLCKQNKVDEKICYNSVDMKLVLRGLFFVGAPHRVVCDGEANVCGYVAGVLQHDGEHSHECCRWWRVQDVSLLGRRAAPVCHAEGRLPALRQPRLAHQWPADRRHGRRPSDCLGLHRVQARIRRLRWQPDRLQVSSTTLHTLHSDIYFCALFSTVNWYQTNVAHYLYNLRVDLTTRCRFSGASFRRRYDKC